MVPASSISTTTAHGDATFRSSPHYVCKDYGSRCIFASLDFELDSSFLSSSLTQNKSSHLSAFDLPVSNRTVPLGSETPGKNTSIPKNALMTSVKSTPPCGFLGARHTSHAFLPLQFAMASYLDSSRLVNSLASRKSRTMFHIAATWPEN